jgi:hypothetical protein
MANPNLTRRHQKIFSENATNNGQFGSLQTGAKVETPAGEELPSLEEFNGLHKIETEQLQYLLNKGIPEYSADAEYYIDDIQREVGGTKLYKSLTDNNIGNALTDTLNWQELGDLADLIGLNQATTTASGFSLLPQQITIENDSGDLDHDILFNAGNFNFDDGSGQAVLSSNLIKQIDAAWVAGNNQGGLDTGTVAPDTVYYIFAIYNPLTAVGDILYSASLSPTLPSGFTNKTRIASLITDGSGNIRQGKYTFSSDGSYDFEYKSKILDLSLVGAASTSKVDFPVTIPPDTIVKVRASMFRNNIVDAYVNLLSPYDDSLAPSFSNADLISDSAYLGSIEKNILSNSLGEISYISSSATLNNFTVVTLGWEEKII